MDLAAARDIAIIILAVLNIVAILIAIVLLLVLIGLLRGQIIPLMESLRRTAGTVEGTTTYLSRTAVSPLVRVAGVAAAATKFVQTMRSGPAKNKEEGH